MADAEGLLGQQLGIATQIPYENIKSNQTSLEMGLNAWAMSTGIKLKRAELEDKMAALVARNRQLEISTDLREKMAQMRMESMAASHSIAEQRLELDRDKMGQAWDISTRTNELKKAEDERKYGKLQDQTDASQGIYSGLAEIEKYKGTPEYNTKLDELFSRNSKAPASFSSRMYNKAYQDHTKAWDLQNKYLETERKNITDGLSHDLYGVGNKGDPSILDAQDKYFVPHYKLKGGRSVPWEMRNETDPVTGKPYAKEFKYTPDGQTMLDPNYRSFKVIDPNDGSTKYKPVATQRLNDYSERLKAYNENKARIGSRPYNPEAGVTRYQPGDSDIEHLRTSTDPKTRRNFDARFGTGSSDRYLQDNTGD